MNRKGLYTGIVAVIAIAIIAGFAFSSLGIANTEHLRGNSESLADFKRQAHNIEFVLGKSVADAIADTAFDQGCSFDQPATQAKAILYLNQALGDIGSNFPNCSVSNVVVAGAGGMLINITATFDLACQKDYGSVRVTRFEKSQTFQKRLILTALPLPLSCEINVENSDLAGNPTEVAQSY
jgi:hypothetical protein